MSRRQSVMESEFGFWMKGVEWEKRDARKPGHTLCLIRGKYIIAAGVGDERIRIIRHFYLTYYT